MLYWEIYRYSISYMYMLGSPIHKVGLQYAILGNLQVLYIVYVHAREPNT